VVEVGTSGLDACAHLSRAAARRDLLVDLNIRAAGGLLPPARGAARRRQAAAATPASSASTRCWRLPASSNAASSAAFAFASATCVSATAPVDDIELRIFIRHMPMGHFCESMQVETKLQMHGDSDMGVCRSQDARDDLSSKGIRSHVRGAQHITCTARLPSARRRACTMRCWQAGPGTAAPAPQPPSPHSVVRRPLSD
jgi:hypothetical protein